MRHFELTEDLLTGIEDIDKHHRALIELVNKAVDPSAIKRDGRVFEDALQFLADYVTYHFAAEEYVMLEHGYPNYEHHRQWHERYKHEVSNWINRAKTEGLSKDLRVTISVSIEDWLLEHVRITDKGLALFLRQKVDGAMVHLPDGQFLKKAGRLPEHAAELPAGTGHLHE
jgi:hemerythrin